MRGDRYQIVLIFLGVVATILFSHFLYKEIFPEYRIYQKDYIALEKFRSTYTGEPPPEFSEGVKQIVFEREDKGPAKIDRCTSCHVAMQLFHFSPVKIEHDANGSVIKVPNEEYVWGRLDQKIAALVDEKVNAQLIQEGNASEVEKRKQEAALLASYKTAKVGEHVYDVSKVLAMHPLIGNETRPFELHPIDDYGCTSCHGGNGRGLTTETAHGPVFDGEYEAEFMGPKPEFTEKDPLNDPLFSRVFNSKPGDDLLFQTTPILVGSLIQSSCIQCHGQSKAAVHLKNSGTIDLLTENYYRGRELFFSQACYACHRISGMARGGVGPELTLAGNSYPWYLKESIVWPQADLRTSTMPNYVLDHVEIEDLMTFLLSQKGRPPAISETDYKVSVQKWEGGRKMPWEDPVPPSQIQDVRYGMKIFATEGCAACHRLEGFQSNVGYRIEKEKDVNFEQLDRERQWLRTLFPEESRGSAIVRAIEAHVNEIDEHIISDARQGSILEEIEKEYPGVIEAFYSDFHYAERAKNHDHGEMVDKKAAAIAESMWKERIHRILMMYIQEYGLGRLIGPRPNWSGVYRSDEWLMEHFHNPGAHVPRSIMPVFPFDDTKFYTLTYMLDVLGKRNRDAVRDIWNHKGFDPHQAFEIFCSQCHGPYLQGNGPVATWIYPIPKNLRNAEFMRNLTREHVFDSIMHGVRGTPMPPWGETPQPKPGYDAVPVLSQEEIRKLVDWMFSSLPGETVIKGVEDVPKWHYTTKDVSDELKKEGGSLKAELFYVVPNPVPGEEKNLYYIKKEYYTKENLAKGERFFELNCAVCHGSEADGMGMRASIMLDAKPRMLTNLDWLKTRDDLRLLRSIKYGVPGTAMTPWGDLTSSEQRLQLVMFIRSLSDEKEKRDSLMESLYNAFDIALLHVEQARIQEYLKLDILQNKYVSIERERQDKEKDSADKAVSLYKEQLELSGQIDAQKRIDEQFVALKVTVSKEKDLYQGIGNELIAADVGSQEWTNFLKLMELNKGHYSVVDGKLSIRDDKDMKEQKVKLIQEIASGLNEKERKKFLSKIEKDK